jgi:[NiFe] hydrogenase assembly HybE family chaperone
MSSPQSPWNGPVRDHDANPAPLVEDAYRLIERERMQGIPILNRALQVETVGFRGWNRKWIGILVTPWFMNVMLLPGNGAHWPRLSAGAKHTWRLPYAPMEFMVGYEESIGEYHLCSLFSPTLLFPDQDAARATAWEAMDTLMSPPNTEGQVSGAMHRMATRIGRPMSKRDFLTGHAFRDYGPVLK